VILSITNLTRRFGGVVALDAVTLEVPPHQVFGIIGPNGAGKTTLFNVITGIMPPSEGDMLFEGRPLAGLRTDQVAKRGIARTFQNIRLFKSLTVLENAMVGAICQARSTHVARFLRTPGASSEHKRLETNAKASLAFVGLESWQDARADVLPYGYQRRLEIARAMATGPKLLLLDEPAAVMNPHEAEDLMHLLRRTLETGITLVVIDHNMDLVMGICDRIAVLDYGEKIAEGTPAEIQRNQDVIDAYLGVDHSDAAT
jgi:branched-chain amino acid transport system ATP-binding protein